MRHPRAQMPYRGALAALSILTGACGGGSGIAPTPTPAVPAPPSGGSLKACTNIQTPGSYTVVADLVSPLPAVCLSVAASGVTLDCGSHRVSSVTIAGVQNVAVNHCSIGGTVDSPSSGGTFLIISQASSVTVTNSNLNDVTITHSDHVVLDSDHIIDQNPRSIAAVSIASGSFVTVSNSVVDHFQAYGILLGTGHDNTITGNTIDGTDPGSAASTRRDDAVTLDTEMNDLIANNSMISLPDAGVEGENSVTGTVIDGNTMQGIGFAGIGSYYETSWHGNTIRNNRVSGSRWFLDFEYLGGGNVNTPLLVDIGFTGNVIENNVARVAGQDTFCVNVGFVPPIPLPVVVSNNTIRGNDFGTGALRLAPSSAFINAGGNICAASDSFVCR